MKAAPTTDRATPPWDEALGSWTARTKQILTAEDVTLVFGGHFSSGKSTLINALIGRSLLPTGDLPETGLACVLRRGSRDRALLVAGGESRELSCETAALAEATSLIGADGAYRDSVLRGGGRLEITLADAPIPAHALWVDSPGINDTPEMTERAGAVCAEADVLVWVVNSGQPLSMAEQGFLLGYRDENGPHSVVFVVNCFLPRPSPQAWERYVADRAQYHRDRIEAQVGSVGPVEPVLVCAQAVCAAQEAADAAGAAGYGAAELRSLINRIATAEDRLVKPARCGRAAAQAAVFAARLSAQLDAARSRRKAAETAAAAQERRRSTEQSAFTQRVGRLGERLFTDWSAAARQAGQDASARLSTGPILRDGSPGRALDSALQEAAASLAAELADGAAQLAGGIGRAGRADHCRRQLARLLDVDEVSFEIAGKLEGRILPNRADPVAGAAGRAVGGLFPSLSSRTLKRIDEIAVSSRKKLDVAIGAAEIMVADRERTKQNAVEAADRVRGRLARRQEEAVAVILEAYALPAALPAPDDNEVERLSRALEGLDKLMRKWAAA